MPALRLFTVSMLIGVSVLVFAGPIGAYSRKDEVATLRTFIQAKRSVTWYWQDIAQIKHTPTAYHERWAKGVRYLRWLNQLWEKRSLTAHRYAKHPPHLAMWLCIHGREATWTDNASNNPHWGGLQMGDWFMNTYGRHLLGSKGKANNWTPLEQIWVAERAYQREHYSREWLFGQWPDTAPPCV